MKKLTKHFPDQTKAFDSYPIEAVSFSSKLREFSTNTNRPYVYLSIFLGLVIYLTVGYLEWLDLIWLDAGAWLKANSIEVIFIICSSLFVCLIAYYINKIDDLSSAVSLLEVKIGNLEDEINELKEKLDDKDEPYDPEYLMCKYGP